MSLKIYGESKLFAKFKSKLLEAVKALNQGKVDAALQQLDALDSLRAKESIPSDPFKCVVGKFRMKALLQKGEFFKCLELVQEKVKELREELGGGELKDLDLAQAEKNEAFFYLFQMKFYEVKVLKKLRQYKKSEELIDEMFQCINSKLQQKEKKEIEDCQAAPFWGYILKALYFKVDFYCKTKEFETAKFILHSQAKPTLLALLPVLNLAEGEEGSLPSCPYTFRFRRAEGKFLRRFCFLEKSRLHLKQLLKDELAFYNLAQNPVKEEKKEELKEGEEAKEEAKEDLFPPEPLLNNASLSSDKLAFGPKALPLLKVKDTYIELARALGDSNRIEEGSRYFDVAAKIVEKVFGSRKVMDLANILRLVNSMLLKFVSARVRIGGPISDRAKKNADEYQEIVKESVGESAHYYMAVALMLQADVEMNSKNYVEAEKLYLASQTKVSSNYSCSDHPLILNFNRQLIDSYGSQSSNDEKRRQTLLICDKNVEIAEKHYGATSLYTLRYYVSLCSCHIAQKQIAAANQAMVKIRQALIAFHGNDPFKMKNQYYFVTQALLGMSLLATQNVEIAERLLISCLELQLQYVEANREHPFLEQTVLNIAIYYRTIQQYSLALKMFDMLGKIQEQIYHDDKEALVYTYKNLGVCALGLGHFQTAEEHYKKSLNLLLEIKEKCSSLAAPTEQAQIDLEEKEIKEDNEQLASLYFNLYLAAATSEDRPKAIEYNLKQMEYHCLLYGEQSLQVSNCHFIQGHLKLKEGAVAESKEWIEKAIDLLEGSGQAERQREAYLLTKIKYFVTKANICYILGQVQEALKSAEVGHEICSNKQNFSYESLADVERLTKEIEGTKVKCEARLKNTNAWELKKQQVKEEEEGEEASGDTFGMLIGSVMMGLATFSVALLLKDRFA